MERIRLQDKTFKTFIPYEKISAAIDAVTDMINADFKDCEDVPVLLCVLNGSIMFMGELMKRLDFNCQIISIKHISGQEVFIALLRKIFISSFIRSFNMWAPTICQALC